jgi:hypothetical protein
MDISLIGQLYRKIRNKQNQKTATKTNTKIMKETKQKDKDFIIIIDTNPENLRLEI